MSGEWNPEPPPASHQRMLRSAIYLVGVPLAILLVVGGIGAIDGLTDSDCQAGLFSACGVWNRAAAWMVFVGSYLLVAYYAVVLFVYLYRQLRKIVRS